jgi:tetratricopeptide (TPR) repeat protein
VAKDKDKLEKEFLQTNEVATLTERAIDTLKPFVKQIGMAAVGVAVIGVGYLIYSAVAGHQAAKASGVLAKSLRIQSAQVVTDSADDKAKAAAKALSKGDKDDDDEGDTPKFKSYGERYAALQKEFGEAKSLGAGKLGKVAEIGEAGVLLSQGKYAESETAYRRILGEVSSDFPLRFLVVEGLGYSLEGQNKLKEALQAYKDLEPKEGGFYRDRALYHQGRMYEKLGDDEKAEKTYEQARKLERTTMFEAISTRLNALKERRGKSGGAAKPAEKAGDKPATEKASGKAADKAPEKAADKPATDQPAADKPAADKPAAEKAAEKPATP